MTVNGIKTRGYEYSNEFSSRIRSKSGLLVVISSSAVAFAFGLSFYFALVSSQTAIATQVPELAPIVQKLKSTLVINTVGFVAVIIASFWYLSRLVSAKMFVPLGTVMAGIRKAAENRYIEPGEDCGSGPFGEFETTWKRAISGIRDREKREIETIEFCLQSLSGAESAEAKKKLEDLRDEKKRRIGTSEEAGGKNSPDPSGADDKLFMQPV